MDNSMLAYHEINKMVMMKMFKVEPKIDKTYNEISLEDRGEKIYQSKTGGSTIVIGGAEESSPNLIIIL